MDETVAAGQAAFTAGFVSLNDEIDAVTLPVTGALPQWLRGTLIRNGPAKFEVDGGQATLRHWFDGQAMLHRFTIAETVTYQNRFLQSENLRAIRAGRIGFAEFATDPCRSIFARFFTRFQPPSAPSGNACVNVTPMGDGYAALSETPIAVEFDPRTLATVGVTDYPDDLVGQVSTAHPHRHPGSGDLVNYLLHFARRSHYQIYRQRPGGTRRELVARIPARYPGYLHSFAVTERYAVLAVYPLVVNPLSFVLRSRPFIENYRWRPELGTQFLVVDLDDGEVRGPYRTDPCFAFHHINAFEDGGELVIDLCAYPDARVVQAFYLDRVRSGAGIPLAYPTRFRLDLASGAVLSSRLADAALELPRIAYGGHNGRDYGFTYGVGARDNASGDFFNQLVKVDVRTTAVSTWHEPDCYPGEPVFVAAPGAVAEDDGVLLSVVLDARTGRSFLLALSAGSMRELARAWTPHVIPFGFHGQFL